MDPQRNNTRENHIVHVEITCRHGSLKQDTQEYIARKVEKLLHFFERVSEIEVAVEFEGNRCSVEIIVNVDNHQSFVAEVEGDEVGPVFDRTLHKMEQQIRRHKDKLKDRRRTKSVSKVVDIPIPDQSEAE